MIHAAGRRPGAWLGASMALLLVSAAVPVAQSQTAVPQGLIMGRVVDGTSGAGVAGAAVTISRPAAPGPPGVSVLTDAEGRFVISSVPAGRINMTLTARGYLQQPFGALRPGGAPQPIELAAGEKLTNLVVRIWKAASIKGRILDEAGEPVEGVSVGFIRKEIVSGRPRYSVVGGGGSDDRGIYPSPPLVPGSYLVVISAMRTTMPASIVDMANEALAGSNADRSALEKKIVGSNVPPLNEPGYRVRDLYLAPFSGSAALISAPDPSGHFSVIESTFYPAASSPNDATVITVAAGEERTGIDLNLRMVPSVSVSGVVSGPDGPVAFTDVRMALESMGQLGKFIPFESGATLTDAQGRFTLLGITRGSYVARSRPTFPAAPGGESDSIMTAAVTVSVGDQNVRDVVVALTEAPRVSGRVEFEGATTPAPAQLARLAIEAQTVDSQFLIGAPPVPRGAVTSDRQFKTTGVTPGWYVLRATGLPGWTIRTAMRAGKDLSDEPFEATAPLGDVVVTLTDRATTVTGIVTSPEGKPDADATVLVFPSDPARSGVRRRQSARVDKNGAYALNGLPAGEYLLVAINDQFAADWEEPPFLNSLVRLGTRVTVPSSGALAMDLRTSAVRREAP